MSGHSLSFRTAGSLAKQDLHTDFEGVVAPSSSDLDGTAYDSFPIAPEPRAGMLCVSAYESLKRGLDIALSLTALIVLSPFLALIALAIKLQDGGSILFAQDRVGKNGKIFRFYKFRSMVRDADRLKDQLTALNEHGDHRTFKMKDDPRITLVGRILRRASLDELPQLWNILNGDMTFVGPRPAVPREVALYTPDDMRRLEVTPGLTCLWQISGRADLAFAEQVRLDVEYIETRSMLRDLEIIALTIPAVLSGRGAY